MLLKSSCHRTRIQDSSSSVIRRAHQFWNSKILRVVGRLLQVHAGEGTFSSVGVLWVGAAAADCVRTCIHRVCSHAGLPHLSCWNETCTPTQIAIPMLERHEKTRQRGEGDEALRFGNVISTERVV